MRTEHRLDVGESLGLRWVHHISDGSETLL